MNKNKPEFKPRLQPSKETNITGVKRNLLAESEIKETDKEIAENTLKNKTTSETTGTPLPVGYDPDLPMGKQREYIGLV